MGYHRAGFDEIVGVDIKPQPRYPFTFVQGDALGYLAEHWQEFDGFHASPPCQAFTQMSARWRGRSVKADSHPRLIAPVRAALERTGRPYVIENVVGARKAMRSQITLSGGHFGLGTHRPRLFESNQMLLAPPYPGIPNGHVGVYGEFPDGRRLWTRKSMNGTVSVFHAAKSVEEARAAMGIDWMDWRELAESIPPAYTEYIGRQLLSMSRPFPAPPAQTEAR